MRRLSVGAKALLVELDEGADVAAVYQHIRRLTDDGRLPAVRDLVPAARTVLVDGTDPDAWWRAFAAVGDPAPAGPGRTGDVLTLRIRYDGEDLDDVGQQWGCRPEEVIRRHQEADFTVAFCGFAPGFAYCTSEPELPEVARRDEPRTAVPAGAVGLAGPYCGIYPTAMPGGWQLIGSTDAVLFDVDREQPALLSPGVRVRFHVVDEAMGSRG